MEIQKGEIVTTARSQQLDDAKCMAGNLQTICRGNHSKSCQDYNQINLQLAYAKVDCLL